ncbi:MAG: hypothetical protein KC416_08395, partial [Myxococcales bacterium]|nr:hypothetical protein [Myxococcales bacterium]
MTHGTVTLAVTVAILAGAIFQVASLDLLMMGGLTLLLLFGVLTPAEAFVGFANEAVLIVAALFVIAQGIRDTGALDFLVRSVLGRPKGTARAQLRLMLPVGALSAFLNNTPVVAMLVPVVLDWSRRIQVPASKLMMPLSFAAMMGGACTII